MSSSRRRTPATRWTTRRTRAISRTSAAAATRTSRRASPSAAPRWPTVQDWTKDVREARRNYGPVIVQRLKELGVERGRIGITGLGETEGTRTPEGTIFYGTWKNIREGFPNATLVDATDILAEVRYTKSQEESDALTKSMEIIKKGMGAKIRAARPGARD